MSGTPRAFGARMLYSPPALDTATVATTTTPRRYERRTPETSPLYQVVNDHLAELLEHARIHSEHGAGYPRFVEREFERFLDCGLLCRGFVRVRCDTCAAERLVAFSCKTRGFCPSCTARRMAETAAQLIDNVLPPVPYRQWVLSLPRRVRFLLACNHSLLSRVLRVFVRKLGAWQRRRARQCGLCEAHTGAVSFVQRFGSLLNLNCHFHTLVPDGVFVRDHSGALRFHLLPPPRAADLARLVHQIGRAIEKLVERHQADNDADGPADILAHEQHAAITARLGSARAPATSSAPDRHTAFVAGYSLHAGRVIDGDDRAGLERLCRYGARAPIANTRLHRDADGHVVVTLRKPIRDGRTQLRFTPIDFLRRLATLIPPPRKNLTRYHGVFAPNHHLRAHVVAYGRPDQQTSPERPPQPSRRRINWADLLRRVFAIDVLRCDRCQSPMRILAVINDGQVTRAILEHLQLPTEPPAPRGLDPPRCS